MIHKEIGTAAFAAIDDLLDRLGAVTGYRRLFDSALRAVRASADAAPIFLPVDLTAISADLLGLGDEVAVVAAAASTLVWSGADLMDDAADRQLDERWQGTSPHQISLVATNLLSTLPGLVVSDAIGNGPAAAAYAHALSRTLFSMSEGQWTDLGSPATVPDRAAYMGLIRRKSGAEFALFASTPALLGEEPDEVVAGWVGFGMTYGTMVQAFSDARSVMVDGPRNDLLDGKRALPVLFALETTGDSDHESLLASLDLARQGDQSAAARAVEIMRGAGSLQRSTEHCELLRYRSAEALPARLADLPLDHPVRSLLRVYSML